MKSVRVNARACSAAAALLMLGGCSLQALYAGAQETQKMECRKMQGDARDRCLQNVSMSYTHEGGAQAVGGYARDGQAGRGEETFGHRRRQELRTTIAAPVMAGRPATARASVAGPRLGRLDGP